MRSVKTTTFTSNRLEFHTVKTTTALFTKGVTKNYTLCGLTNSKGTCGNKMLQYVSIKDKYKLNVIKYTTTVNAGNF